MREVRGSVKVNTVHRFRSKGRIPVKPTSGHKGSKAYIDMIPNFSQFVLTEGQIELTSEL